jgi:hypothetical protein
MVNNNSEIIIFFLYVNNDNELHNIIKKKEIIHDGVFPQERQMYIIKENEYYNSNFYKLIASSYFNFYINEHEINNLFKTSNENSNEKSNENSNFYSIQNMIDTIVFNKTIVKNINSVFYIYKNYVSHNTTKKIILQSKKQTRKLNFLNALK